jgi:hypothetical protein
LFRNILFVTTIYVHKCIYSKYEVYMGITVEQGIGNTLSNILSNTLLYLQFFVLGSDDIVYSS